MVLLGAVEVEPQLVEVLDRPDVALNRHDQLDLVLAGVGRNRVELGFQHLRRAFDANLRRLGEIAVAGELVDRRHFGDRLAKLGPDVALGVKQADQHLLVDDLMVGVQVGAGGQEDAVRPDLPQGVREGVLHPAGPFDLGRGADGGEVAAAEGAQVAVGAPDEPQAVGRQTENPIGLLGFRPADLDDIAALLEVAIAHPAVGDDDGMNGGPLGQAGLERQPCADGHVVIVWRDEHPALGRPLQSGSSSAMFDVVNSPVVGAAKIRNVGSHLIGFSSVLLNLLLRTLVLSGRNQCKRCRKTRQPLCTLGPLRNRLVNTPRCREITESTWGTLIVADLR